MADTIRHSIKYEGFLGADLRKLACDRLVGRSSTTTGTISSSTTGSDDEESIEDEDIEIDIGKTANVNAKLKVYQQPLGTRIKIKSLWFDGDKPGSYSKGKPEYTFGTLIKKNKAGILSVRYDGDKKPTRSHWTHLELAGHEKATAYTVMAAVVHQVGQQYTHSDTKLPWPKHFFDALTRSDWRKWVEATKKEMKGWDDNHAYELVKTATMNAGDPLIPLGELYSIKRDGRYKFRQIAMGNFLSKDRDDYRDTFSCTVTHDGLRWFCSLGCACNKRIKGWDATCGYLQSPQRKPLYFHLPSHAKYSSQSYEALAELRKRLIDMKENDPATYDGFIREHKPNRKVFPTEAWRACSAVYGVPDAGQSFAMEMQALHIKQCGMTQSEIDPSIYYKITEDADGKVIDYIVIVCWTDDVRYFGTDSAVAQYERTIVKHMKLELEGDSDGFVSCEIKQDLVNKTLELTQAGYWEKAAVRFEEHYPNGVPHRTVPLTPGECDSMLRESTEDEVNAAKHLPYRELLGLINYPCTLTKLECRYYISVASRHSHAWSKRHFDGLLKVLAYCYTTRHIGIMYSALRAPSAPPATQDNE
eukprot:g2836.t1